MSEKELLSTGSENVDIERIAITLGNDIVQNPEKFGLNSDYFSTNPFKVIEAYKRQEENKEVGLSDLEKALNIIDGIVNHFIDGDPKRVKDGDFYTARRILPYVLENGISTGVEGAFETAKKFFEVIRNHCYVVPLDIDALSFYLRVSGGDFSDPVELASVVIDHFVNPEVRVVRIPQSGLYKGRPKYTEDNSLFKEITRQAIRDLLVVGAYGLLENDGSSKLFPEVIKERVNDLKDIVMEKYGLYSRTIFSSIERYPPTRGLASLVRFPEHEQLSVQDRDILYEPKFENDRERLPSTLKFVFGN